MRTPPRRQYPSAKRQRGLFHRLYSGDWEVWGHEYEVGFFLYRNHVLVGLFINCKSIHEAHRLALYYIVKLESGMLENPDMFGRVMQGRIRFDATVSKP